ncbi:cobyric acid synthase [Dyadobacter psychrophilus]|uniref:Cobyric acid synthase n=1 Tax=Dyadobacter psychrophilus TaxID=651661 RepID=A0A1T5G6S2_9BACT|nr:cobyric acid synthase [Dyadobacter psychrophilus]SKC04203.1 adenosylcobyric acid synthase (glutamine-hydrolysing) [Dyadobacter psychrophilus]
MTDSIRRPLRPIMFVGTGSDVGKSVITAGFCRIFKQDGFQPAPFKAQNMSLNSYVTAEGLELGRAQAVQAEAAGVPCLSDMNPVLLKPTSDRSSQVVLNGKPVGNQSAYEYFMANDRRELFESVKQAFDRLSGNYNPVVMEGAGSISELNLKHRDITNLRMAAYAGAATYLIGDIDRGGVFGSVYGTIALLTDEEKACMKGIIINKFRGDGRLFEDGKRMLEDLTGLPVVGILPYFRDIHIEQEDSVSLESKYRTSVTGKVNVAVILLRRLSNFTDFDRLENDERVNLFFTIDPHEVAKADIVIVPGSKNTIDDMLFIKNNGVAKAILQAQKAGKTVIGICGGYQMLGEMILDPHHVEGTIESMPGLGILPVVTTLQAEKTTLQCQFRFRGSESLAFGYEIHMGETVVRGQAKPVATLSDGRNDGCFLNDKTWGTYLHGILDNDDVIAQILQPYTSDLPDNQTSFQAFKEQQYDKLADLIRSNVNMELIYKTLRY